MMKNPFAYPSTVKEQVCKCGKHYGAKWLLIVDEWRDTTSGMCGECFTKWRIEQDRQESTNKETELKLQFERKRITFREQNSGIPLYYQNKTFDNINSNVKGNMKKVCPECIRYADNYPLDYNAFIKSSKKSYPSLLLASPNIWGVGKTHLICAIFHRIIDRWQGYPYRCPMLFTTEPDIYLRIQNTYSMSDTERRTMQSETDIINELASIPLLAIDDIGKQKRSDMKFVQRTLFTIFNKRYDSMKPTIFTTNMNLEQLERYLGANDSSEDDRASFDRLLEMCKGNLWLLEGESQRGK
jgi:DNA replication protein DnaC